MVSIILHVEVNQGDNLSPNLPKIFINNPPEYFVTISDDCVQLGKKSRHCLLYADEIVLKWSTTKKSAALKIGVLI